DVDGNFIEQKEISNANAYSGIASDGTNYLVVGLQVSSGVSLRLTLLNPDGSIRNVGVIPVQAPTLILHLTPYWDGQNYQFDFILGQEQDGAQVYLLKS